MVRSTMRVMHIALSAVCALAFVTAGARADGLISELKLGLLAHDQGLFTANRENGIDGNVELLFRSPKLLEPIFAPRPHLGATINSAGNTHQAYAGLTWTLDFLERGFFDVSFGGTYHTADTDTLRTDRKKLGCSVLFRESLGLGFRLSEHHSIMLHADHVSNAALCDSNEGLETVGIRYGYRF